MINTEAFPMRSIFKAILTVAVVGVFLAASSSAEAAFKVRASIDGGATWITATDQVTGGGGNTRDDLTAGAGEEGILTANLSFQGVVINVAIGSSKPLVGGSGFSVLDISADGAFLSNATVILEITDTGFAPPLYADGLGILTADLDGSSAANANLTGVSYTSYLQGNDGVIDGQEFGGSPDGPGVADITAGPDTSYPGFEFSEGVAVSAYSMTGRLVFSGQTGDGFSFDSLTTFSTPLPGGAVLALTALPVLGVGGWIRRRKAASK